MTAGTNDRPARMKAKFAPSARRLFRFLLFVTISQSNIAGAEQLCSLSEQGRIRVLRTMCTTEAENAPADACISLEKMKMNTLESSIFIEALSRNDCDEADKKLAHDAFAGLSKILDAEAVLARCFGIEMDVSNMIAEARAELQEKSKGLACPSAGALEYSRQQAAKFLQAEALVPMIYQEAGVVVDSAGNVTEK